MKMAAVNLQVVREADFSCHFEHGSLIIDKCTGISPEAGLALFDPWILEAMHDKSALPEKE